MAGNDHHPDGTTGSTRASNVVHLRPRQWLESEDELVPIGAATTESGGDRVPADGTPTDRRPPRSLIPPRDRNGSAGSSGQAGAQDERGHASTWLGTGEKTVPIAREPTDQAPTTEALTAAVPTTTVPTAAAPADNDLGDAKSQTASWAASDFWSEDAAQVQDALEAPVPAQRPEAARRAERRYLRNLHWLLRAPVLATITVAAVAVIGAAINGFGSAPPARRISAPTPRTGGSTSGVRASRSAPPTPEIAAAGTTAARLRTTRAASQHRSTGRTHLRARSRPAASRHRTRRHHRGATVATTTAAVRYIAPPPVSTPAPAPVSAAARTTYRSVTPTQATSASSPSHAGPTGTVSLVGPGTSPSG